MKKINPKFNRYIYLGVTLLAVFAGGMLIHYVFSALFGNLSSFRSFFSALNSALMPVYIGIIIAYLLSPDHPEKERKGTGHSKRLVHILFVAISYCPFGGFVLDGYSGSGQQYFQPGPEYASVLQQSCGMGNRAF